MEPKGSLPRSQEPATGLHPVARWLCDHERKDMTMAYYRISARTLLPGIRRGL
jgi:hypothetical protein